MLQIYFLSILLNAVAGYVLIAKEEEGILGFKNTFNLKDDTFRLVLGILTVVTGLFKLLSPIEGDLPIVGDLFPAAAGLLAGFILIYEYYKNRSTLDDTEHIQKINRVFIGNKKIIGIAALVVAVLHFIFPKMLLL